MVCMTKPLKYKNIGDNPRWGRSLYYADRLAVLISHRLFDKAHSLLDEVQAEFSKRAPRQRLDALMLSDINITKHMRKWLERNGIIFARELLPLVRGHDVIPGLAGHHLDTLSIALEEAGFVL
jgi:hypothetical protein